MAGEDIAARAQKLRELIAYHSWRYYVLDDPEISDDAYDALVRELEQIERDHPELVTPDSPTQRVGAPPSEQFAPVRRSHACTRSTTPWTSPSCCRGSLA